MEIDDGSEGREGCNEIHHVWQVLAVKGLFQGPCFIIPGEQEMEQTNDRTLELGPSSSVDGRGRKCLPNNVLADICGDEQGNTASDSITFLKHLVEKDDNHTSGDKLGNKENDNSPTKFGGFSIQSRRDVHNGLSERQDQGKYYGLVALHGWMGYISGRFGKVRDPI